MHGPGQWLAVPAVVQGRGENHYYQSLCRLSAQRHEEALCSSASAMGGNNRMTRVLRNALDDIFPINQSSMGSLGQWIWLILRYNSPLTGLAPRVSSVQCDTNNVRHSVAAAHSRRRRARRLLVPVGRQQTADMKSRSSAIQHGPGPRRDCRPEGSAIRRLGNGTAPGKGENPVSSLTSPSGLVVSLRRGSSWLYSTFIVICQERSRNSSDSGLPHIARSQRTCRRREA